MVSVEIITEVLERLKSKHGRQGNMGANIGSIITTSLLSKYLITGGPI